MDFGAIMLILVIGGGLAGGAYGAMIYLKKANKIRKHFNVTKGMAYEQIVAAFGEPNVKNPKGEKLICEWFFDLEGKRTFARAVFVNNIAKSIG